MWELYYIQTPVSSVSLINSKLWNQVSFNQNLINYLFVCCVCVNHSGVSDSLRPHKPGSSVHGILQSRIVEWVAIPFSRGSSKPWDWTQVSCIAGRFFASWATRVEINYLISLIAETQKKTLYMDITRWSTPKSDWLYSLQPKMEKLYTVSKKKTRSWLWLRPWTPYCQIQT